MQKRCTVGDFSFTVELRDVDGVEPGQRANHPPYPTCTADEERYSVLATALSSAWGKDGSLLVHLLEGRIAYSKEGVVGFNYDGDSPDESPDGKVRVFYMEDEQVLEQFFFEAAAVEFGLVAVACLRQVSQPVADDTEQRLLALRQTRIYS